MSETIIATFVTFVVVVDPISTTPLFAALTAEASASERRRIALRGVAIATGVLIAFALGGEWLLTALGIGLPAFRIAGGILLLLLAIDMVMARQSGLRAMTPGEEAESNQRADVSVFPLAIPLIAGPGALTMVVLLMGAAAGDLRTQAVIIAVLVAVLVVTLACLLLVNGIMRLLGVTGINVVTRVFGIITAALAVQFIVDGHARGVAGGLADGWRIRQKTRRPVGWSPGCIDSRRSRNLGLSQHGTSGSAYPDRTHDAMLCVNSGLSGLCRVNGDVPISVEIRGAGVAG